jgi:hypothetical protein
MKVGKHDVTMKNIHAYLQGNLRMLAEQYGPDYLKMDPHIKEQIIFRMDVSNPECIQQKECKECHCEIPNLMYANKQCGGQCYPEMMDADKWEEFKKTLRIYTLENNIEKIGYPFDWKHIESLMGKEEINKKETLISGTNTTKIDDKTVNLPDQVIGSIIMHTFQLHNHNDQPVFIKDINTSCGCTTLDEVRNKIIQPGETLNVQVRVDTNGKRAADAIFTSELIFNNATKTRLSIIFKLTN